jgi:thymidylate synthase ThyX
MEISATVVLDSVNPDRDRLTTLLLVFPKWLQAELNTHRAISKSSASSRAIPVEKTMARVRKDPFVPAWWGANKKGMSAAEEVARPEECAAYWLSAAESAMAYAAKLKMLGVHKQHVNRLLEPFLWTSALVSATEWNNFFHQRCPADGPQPEMSELANKILAAVRGSEPTSVAWGGWHVPFGDRYLPGLTREQQVMVSTARCARQSYENFHGEIDHEDDFRLYRDLLLELHMSPFEHCAYADPEPRLAEGQTVTPPMLSRLALRSNFRGWVQHRKQIRGENRSHRYDG